MASLAALDGGVEIAPPNNLPLPGELIDAILALLSPAELAVVSQVCHGLRVHAMADRLWHAFVQAGVPGTTVTTPYPCATFRELYIAHEPRWFLTQHKIWFSGRDMVGKVILTRYDQRRGCIEGYQMIAFSNHTAYYHWPPDANVVVHAFEPEVILHMDRPVLHLEANSLENLIRAKTLEINASTRVTFAPSSAPAPGIFEGPQSSPPPISSSASTSTSSSAPPPAPPSRFREIPMLIDGQTGADHFHQTFMFAQPLPADHTALYATTPFPYDNAWPPASVPASHRVMAANFALDRYPLGLVGRPAARSDISDKAFHIRTWFDVNPAAALEEQRITGLGLDEIDTYATVDAVHYTPTEDKPFRGIWVGDYSGHGCEFVLVHQPDDETPFDEATVRRYEGESDADLAKRRRDARIYRGRLEAIKLTGDPNVPRGEYTFVADDLGEAGFDSVMQEPPFAGVRIVKSLGHVAGTGFRNERYVESRLLLISPNRLAQYWVGFGHISFFERVDIDQFLQPS